MESIDLVKKSFLFMIILMISSSLVSSVIIGETSNSNAVIVGRPPSGGGGGGGGGSGQFCFPNGTNSSGANCLIYENGDGTANLLLDLWLGGMKAIIYPKNISMGEQKIFFGAPDSESIYHEDSGHYTGEGHPTWIFDQGDPNTINTADMLFATQDKFFISHFNDTYNSFSGGYYNISLPFGYFQPLNKTVWFNTSNATFGNVFGKNICYANGSNCQAGGGVDNYFNNGETPQTVWSENQTNIFAFTETDLLLMGDIGTITPFTLRWINSSNLLRLGDLSNNPFNLQVGNLTIKNYTLPRNPFIYRDSQGNVKDVPMTDYNDANGRITLNSTTYIGNLTNWTGRDGAGTNNFIWINPNRNTDFGGSSGDPTETGVFTIIVNTSTAVNAVGNKNVFAIMDKGGGSPYVYIANYNKTTGTRLGYFLQGLRPSGEAFIQTQRALRIETGGGGLGSLLTNNLNATTLYALTTLRSNSYQNLSGSAGISGTFGYTNLTGGTCTMGFNKGLLMFQEGCAI